MSNDAPEGWTEEYARMVDWDTSDGESGDLSAIVDSEPDEDAEDAS